MQDWHKTGRHCSWPASSSTTQRNSEIKHKCQTLSVMKPLLRFTHQLYRADMGHLEQRKKNPDVNILFQAWENCSQTDSLHYSARMTIDCHDRPLGPHPSWGSTPHLPRPLDATCTCIFTTASSKDSKLIMVYRTGGMGYWELKTIHEVLIQLEEMYATWPENLKLNCLSSHRVSLLNFFLVVTNVWDIKMILVISMYKGCLAGTHCVGLQCAVTICPESLQTRGSI